MCKYTALKPIPTFPFIILVPMIFKKRSDLQLLPLLKNAIGRIAEGVHDLNAR